MIKVISGNKPKITTMDLMNLSTFQKKPATQSMSQYVDEYISTTFGKHQALSPKEIEAKMSHLENNEKRISMKDSLYSASYAMNLIGGKKVQKATLNYLEALLSGKSAKIPELGDILSIANKLFKSEENQEKYNEYKAKLSKVVPAELVALGLTASDCSKGIEHFKGIVGAQQENHKMLINENNQIIQDVVLNLPDLKNMLLAEGEQYSSSQLKTLQSKEDEKTTVSDVKDKLKKMARQNLETNELIPTDQNQSGVVKVGKTPTVAEKAIRERKSAYRK